MQVSMFTFYYRNSRMDATFNRGQVVTYEGIHPSDFRDGLVYDIRMGSELLFTAKTHDELLGWMTANERLIWKDKPLPEWVEPLLDMAVEMEQLCIDEGCPNQPLPHVCINRVETPEEREQRVKQTGPYDAQGNADHYKNFLVITGGSIKAAIALQWMESQQFKPYFRANPKALFHAILMQADKYLSRLGLKDDEKQEATKVLWYTKFAVAFMKNDFKPIRVEDIPYILGEKDINHQCSVKVQRAGADPEVFTYLRILGEKSWSRAEAEKLCAEWSENHPTVSYTVVMAD